MYCNRCEDSAHQSLFTIPDQNTPRMS